VLRKIWRAVKLRVMTEDRMNKTNAAKLGSRVIAAVMGRRSRRSSRLALAIVLLTLLFALCKVESLIDDVRNFPNKAMPCEAGAVHVDIPKGSGLTQVIKRLEESQVFCELSPAHFKIYVLHEGAAGKITAGKHEFRRNMSPAEILAELLRKPPAETYRVTVPEGKHHLEVAAILAKASGIAEADFIAAMRDAAFLKKMGIPRSSAEGYLFPDTYRFTLGMDAKQIVRHLVERHQQVYDDLRRRYAQHALRLQRDWGWEQPEIVTLASIVEKETGAGKERPLIAGVFLNRLRFASFKPKRLETDPTIIYGCTVALEKSKACGSWEGRIRTIHLRDTENPYNTYTHEGLPPGPISNPGRAALQAVFDPTPSRFLYFVSRNDGTHHFSATIAEHEAAVEKHMRQGVVGGD
jgi:UPF0755 protein